MQCPSCGSTHIRKNGRKSGKQNHICADCRRQFIDVYEPIKGYSNDIKQDCLKMYVNGMGFRAIERGHCVFITPPWFTLFKQLGKQLPDAPQESAIPEVGELDELETFVGSKKTLIWLWTAVNHFSQGILAWVLGDRSAKTFQPLWLVVKCWHSYFYVTDGYKVYPCFLDAANQIVSKTYMTRVENENTRVLTLSSSSSSKKSMLF